MSFLQEFSHQCVFHPKKTLKFPVHGSTSTTENILAKISKALRLKIKILQLFFIFIVHLFHHVSFSFNFSEFLHCI